MDRLAPVITLCPLHFEAERLKRTLNNSGVSICCTGPGEIALTSWLNLHRADLDRAQPRLIILCGLAGGLDESVPTGGAYMVTEVVEPDGSQLVRCDHEAVSNCLSRIRVVSSSDVVRTPGVKAALHQSSGAHLVDLESASFAAEMVSRRMPWIIVRGVSDGLDDELPQAVDRWTRRDGSVDVPRVMASLIRQPGTLRALLRLNRNSRQAIQAAARLIDQVIGGSSE